MSFSWWGVDAFDAPSETPSGRRLGIEVEPDPADIRRHEQPPEWAEPVTEQLRVAVPAVVTEAEHRAALAEIDLPPYPLELAPSLWRVLGSWAAATLQIALGATIGALVVIVALAWIVQASR